MVSIIIDRGWCNDKWGGPWLSVISSSYFYLLSLSSRASSRCQSPSGMQLRDPQGFPRRWPATRSAVIHLSGSVSFALLSFPPLQSLKPHFCLLAQQLDTPCLWASLLAPPSPYDHMPLWSVGWCSMWWKCGLPHSAVMWSAGESWKQAALCSAPQGYLPWHGLWAWSPSSVHHFLLLQTESMCVCWDSWFLGVRCLCLSWPHRVSRHPSELHCF